MKRILLLTIAIVALAVGVAACGGDDDSSAEPAAPAEPAVPAEEPAAPAEEPADAGGGSDVVELSALEDGSLAYDTTELEAQCDPNCTTPTEGEGGAITIAFTNPSETPHNVVVEGAGVNGAPLSEKVEGEIVTMADAPITFKPAPGTYTFYCSVPGHREAGMEGTITVS